jgi:hypothetical protein
MYICKNKRTGKYFIYITDTVNEEALFVTPNAEIKNLKLGIFTDEPAEYTEASLLESNLITKEQLKLFHEYKKNRSDEDFENIEDHFETLSPSGQDLFIKRLQEIVDKNKNKA